MKRLITAAVLLTALVPAASVAKTTAWTGGATYKSGIAKSFSDPANWDNGAPEPGDTVKIEVYAPWDNPVYIGKENGATDAAEAFDVGAEGLTLDVSSSYTHLLVNFTGDGKIVKTGTGMLGFACDTGHAGGVEVRNGTLASYRAYLSLGTGAIELTSAEGGEPCVSTLSWEAGFKNEIRITGESPGYKVLSTGQSTVFGGPVSAEHDVELEGRYGQLVFEKDVTAVGRTLTVKGDNATLGADDWRAPTVTFEQKVDANLVKTGDKRLYLNGTTANPDNSLTIREGSCTIGSQGYWGGTNVVLESGAVELALSTVGALSADACVRIDGDAKINVTGRVRPRIRALTVNGTPVADGAYTASTLPAAITGDGGLVVASAAKEWVGGTTGLLSEPSNWKDGARPEPGDFLVFKAGETVTLSAESFDVGEKGLTIENACSVICQVAFAGAGKVVKRGSGEFWLTKESDASTHAGGTRIEGGVLVLSNRYGTFRFGTGPVEFVAASGVQPFIYSAQWECGLLNALTFVGKNVGNDSHGAVTCSNPVRVGGITADSDIRLHSQYGTLTVEGAVSAHGKTVTVRAFRPKDADGQKTDPSGARVVLNGPVDADVCKIGTRELEMNGVSTCPDDSLTIQGGTCSIAAAGSWAGTNVVLDAVSPGTAVLKMSGNGNLSPDAVVRVAASANAKISIAKGVKVAVAELHVDGQQVPAGTYSAARLPDVIDGEGRLKVGRGGAFTVIVR